MKKGVLSVFLCVIALLCPSFVLGQFGMGCCPAGGVADASCVTVANISFVPWLGFGYQSQGVNVNFPFSGTQGLYFQNLDVRLNNNALWVGSFGLDAAFRQKLRFYGAANTNLFVANAGSLGTGRYIGPYNPATNLDWTGTGIRWWELNLGGMYCLTDDVAILVGYKCDRLTERPQRDGYPFSGEFREAPYSGNENYSSDLRIITRSPYIGLKICQSHLDFSLVWSPFLTSYDVELPLGVVSTIVGSDLAGIFGSNSQWALTGGGGNLLEAFAQSKLNLREILGLNLWLKGSWLQCRGNGRLDQSLLNTLGVASSDSGSSGDAVFTRYLWALGISGQLKF